MAVVLGISFPAEFLAAMLLQLFFPDYQDVAADLVRPVVWLIKQFLELFG
ncbi:hypothetical protein HTIA_2205 [Halorhabdus tiamatea SARL4B]|uniref:Uncharacterized protein n=1 Tax=Halorhabdus tiamatea SARL4B TaxID=1033806 RepID=S6CV91_9EURY|nr:hypothetical protein HTIA_2205 [Halorhabdus tiamatea SARL4B]